MTIDIGPSSSSRYRLVEPSTELRDTAQTSWTLHEQVQLASWISEVVHTANLWVEHPIEDDPPLDRLALFRMAQFLVHYAPATLPRPYMAPLPGGGLQLEWDRAGTHLEIEFVPGGRACCLFDGPSDGWETDLDAAPDKLVAALAFLSQP